MNYLQPSKRKNSSPGKRAFKITSALIVFLFVFHLFFPNFLFGAFYPVGSFFWKTRDFFSNIISHPIGLISSKKKLVEEKDNLERRVSELEAEILSLRSLNREELFLNEILSKKAQENSLISRVLAKPPQSPFDILVIESGSDEGVFSGAHIWDKGILVGWVSEVGRGTSKAELFSSANRETVAEVLRNGLSFTLKGRGGGNFEVSVPAGTDVVVGDIFVLPSSPSQILAKVESIEQRETDSFKKLFLSSPVNIFSLQWVEVERR